MRRGCSAKRVEQNSVEGLSVAAKDDSESAPDSSDSEHDYSKKVFRRIILCDSAADRRCRIGEIIKRALVESDILTQEVPAYLDEDLRASVVVLALAEDTRHESLLLDMIARCKRVGKSVIAYGSGIEQWQISRKCRFLLAGVASLMDSTSAKFPIELLQVLKQSLKTEGESCHLENQLPSLMSEHGIIGDSPAIIRAFRSVVRFSKLSDLPVLITGETGTGKELVAKAISRMDPKRKMGPFIGINCAAIQPNLLESEFFGHRRGAFTGADRDRKGWIRAADGGVLFLDEIGELPLSLQAKLLRVLQENRVLGVGEEHDEAINVRFIAATNQNLEELISGRMFRADLFHRLRVLHIHMPPLRDRASDLQVLVNHFLQKYRNNHSEGADVSRDFLGAMQLLDLPGNVRQLENIVRESIIQNKGGAALDLCDLPTDVLQQLTEQFGRKPSERGLALARQEAREDTNSLITQALENSGWNLSKTLRECERQVFKMALERTDGNQAQAARILGITPRSVYNKVHKYELSI